MSAIITAAVDARDKALLAVMLGAGLRVAEVCGLDVADILTDQDGETALFVRQGKGRKDRTVPVQADVARYIRTYLATTKRRLGGMVRCSVPTIEQPGSWRVAVSVLELSATS